MRRSANGRAACRRMTGSIMASHRGIRRTGNDKSRRRHFYESCDSCGAHRVNSAAAIVSVGTRLPVSESSRRADRVNQPSVQCVADDRSRCAIALRRRERFTSAGNDRLGHVYQRRHCRASPRNHLPARSALPLVTMLLSLCLLVIRLYAPASGTFGVPTERVVSGGAATRASIEGAAVVSVRGEGSSRDEWLLREAARRVAVTSSRVAHPFSVELKSRSPATRQHGPTAHAASGPRATDAAVRIGLGVRAHDSSREAGGSGPLFAYYPTAPPLHD